METKKGTELKDMGERGRGMGDKEKNEEGGEKRKGRGEGAFSLLRGSRGKSRRYFVFTTF